MISFLNRYYKGRYLIFIPVIISLTIEQQLQHEKILTFLNCSTDAKAFARWIRIPFKKDRYNSVRSEYSGMLKEQMDIVNLPGPEADAED